MASPVGGVLSSGPVSLLLNAMLTLFVGLLTWWARKEMKNRAEREEMREHHDRILVGRDDDEKGLVGIVDMHDQELAESDRDRALLQRRMRVVEERVNRLAEDAGMRNGLSEIQEDLRERHREETGHAADDGWYDEE